MHGYKLGSAFLLSVSGCPTRMRRLVGETPYLVSSGEAAEYGAPGLPGLVPRSDGLPGQGADRGVVDVKIKHARGGLLKELAASMTCDGVSVGALFLPGAVRHAEPTRQLVKPDLQLERRVPVLLVQFQVALGDEGYLLIRRLCAQHITCRLVSGSVVARWGGRVRTQAHVLEALLLSDVIVIGTTPESEQSLGRQEFVQSHTC